MFRKSLVVISVISLCLLIVITNIFTPTNVGPLGILLLFLCIYLSLLGVVAFLIYFGSYFVAYFSSAFTVVKPIPRVSFRGSYYYSSVISSAPVMMLALQSVGSVGFYEIILIIIFVVIGLVYVSKRI